MASTTDTEAAPSLVSSIAGTITDALSSSLGASGASTTIPSTSTLTSASSTAASTTAEPVEGAPGSAQQFEGISLRAFLGALAIATIIFAVQITLFLMLRNKLARIFKPKTYLVPERERTEPPPSSAMGMLRALMKFSDREIINKCGLDAYFFLRYLKTLLVIFVPIAVVVIPILVPINYMGGRGQNVVVRSNQTQAAVQRRAEGDQGGDNTTQGVTGLDTLAWGNVKPENTGRYTAHLVLALLVIIWVCSVFFFELRVYIKVRQDYLTSAEHRLRASATTVLVNSIPSKWLSEEALRGLFDVFPGGIRNIWLNRDLTELLEKIHERERVHTMLENAETELVKTAKKNQLKRRAKEEKEMRKQNHTRDLTKQERELRDKQEDERAHRMAESGHGTSSGQHEEVPHDVAEAMSEENLRNQNENGNANENDDENRPTSKGGRNFLGGGLAKVGQGFLGGVGKAGQGFKTLGQGVGNTLETTNGFAALRSSEATKPPTRGSERRRVQIADFDDNDGARTATPMSTEAPRSAGHSRTVSAVSEDSNAPKRSYDPPPVFGNTVRKASNLEDMYLRQEVKFWQFWKPPAGGYASPIPQGAEEDDEYPFPKKDNNKPTTFLEKIRYAIPFLRPQQQSEPAEYPPYKNPDFKEHDAEFEEEWEKWVKEKDRPTLRLPLFSWTPNWLPGLPLINKKADTINWCREELARLNMEIEEDQKHPERYPLMSSAFIQFNHQVSAHMACQSLTHHVPKHMAPRTVEISPRDVIWDNMAITWWQEWIRTAAVSLIIGAMIILWAIPVAFTASLGQLDGLVEKFEWLSFLTANDKVEEFAKLVVGVLPAALLALLLVLVPIILTFLAHLKGAKTGTQVTEFVQSNFFIFLFFQVFLVVSITSFFVASLDDLAKNLQELSNGTRVLDLLAQNLPKAANYFFSYMILQALSTSSGTLLQIGALIVWYVVARVLDSTARNKWTRNTSLTDIKWGSFFPVYTNFACIALIYSVVAPLISVFAIITFSLLWIAQRYSMLYVTRFGHDTGGVLYPRAINQTFTGLYVMELCLAGLFFIVRDENDNAACTTHGIIMLVSLGLTALYQIVLNMSFSPLFRYLPITFEDEACIRDANFQREQDRRLGLLDDVDDKDEMGDDKLDPEGPAQSLREDGDTTGDIEMRMLQNNRGGRKGKFSARNPVKTIGGWAKKDGRARRALTFNTRRHSSSQSAAAYRAKHREKDLEAQRAIGEALFGGYHDEIEDLTPEERDALVRYAFQHYALRARRPTVWLPRDDIGVSDDEIRRTREFSDYIWISNEGTALDSKVRVVYGKAPPDFSEVDIINL